MWPAGLNFINPLITEKNLPSTNKSGFAKTGSEQKYHIVYILCFKFMFCLHVARRIAAQYFLINSFMKLGHGI